jgi:hypothetical protein
MTTLQRRLKRRLDRHPTGALGLSRADAGDELADLQSDSGERVLQ